MVTLQCRSKLYVSKWQKGPCQAQARFVGREGVILRDRLPKTALPKNAGVAEAEQQIIWWSGFWVGQSVQRWKDSKYKGIIYPNSS